MNTLNETSREQLLGIAARVVPASSGLDDAGRREFLEIVDTALGARPEAMQRQLALFLKILWWAPVMRYGRPFGGLAPRRQDGVLRWFQESPVQKIRQGLWGLKTLVFMGYYGRVAAWEEIGYAPGGGEVVGA